MPKPTYPVTAEKITDALRTNGDFMSTSAICEASGLEFLPVIKTIDWMYNRQEILKRFRLGELAVIVDVAEVRVPELGFSSRLDNLLGSIGVKQQNWTEIQVDYGLDWGWHDESPKIVNPHIPSQQIEPR